MGLSRSWEANSLSASQEIPRLLLPEGSLPCLQEPATGPYPEPDESSPQLPLYFSKTHSNIILSSMSMFSEWSLPISFSDQNFVCIFHPSHACYIPYPSHSPWLNHSNNIWQSRKVYLTKTYYLSGSVRNNLEGVTRNSNWFNLYRL
jgi:hypothetical protein